MTDDDVEKIIKRNMNLQMNLAGIRADFEDAQKRTWVGLTYDERVSVIHEHENCSSRELCERIEAALKEKNA